MAAIQDKDERCRQIERRIASGAGVCESCRAEGVSEKTFYRWRKAGSSPTSTLITLKA
jgi:transposase-like protein